MNDSDAALSRLACSACRRQKRKCTRELPSCQLCQKNRRRCEYPEDSPSSQSNDAVEVVSSPRNTFPPLFFLDSYVFNQRRATIGIPPISLPREFLDIVGRGQAHVTECLNTYYETVHAVFPIISQRYLNQHISAHGFSDPDLILLLHCMQALVILRKGAIASDRDAAYYKAKQCLHFIEGCGVISLRVLQSALLLALYEAGNAIYPAAYLTVGHCARLGHALGIHDRRNAAQMFPVPMSWTAVEEIRRTWWGVIVMDRYIHLGTLDRPFACDDARPEDLLPMEDRFWDLGEQTVTQSLAVSSDTTLHAPPFARTCQAAHLLSRVLSHLKLKGADPAQRYSEAIRLHQILRSFQLALGQEVAMDDPSSLAAYSSAIGISQSALITLCDNYTCADLDDPAGVGLPEQLNMQSTALRSLQEIGETLWEFASSLSASLDGGGAKAIVSPFVAQCLYAAATQYAWYIQETGKVELNAIVVTIKSTLRLIGESWKVADEYLAIIESNGF